MKTTNIIAVLVILASFCVGFYYYSQMPSFVASHWNSEGQVDGYMPRLLGLFLLPIISAGIFALLSLMPKIDPLKENIKKFRKYYDLLVLIIILFLFYIHLITIWWNLGWRINMAIMISPAIGVMFYYIGAVMGKTKRNWFMGIRTPWTLSSDSVWEKTHKVGGLLFKVSGVLAILGTFTGEYSALFILVPVIVSSIYATVYSYVLHKREINPAK